MSLCLEAVLCLAEHFETEISKYIYIYMFSVVRNQKQSGIFTLTSGF